MEIILLRHGKPKIPPLKRIKASVFWQWVESYNTSGLCSSSVPTDDAFSIAKKCDAVVCSELLRSIESAKVLGINNISLKSTQFNEAGIPMANWKSPRLSPKMGRDFQNVVVAWLF